MRFRKVRVFYNRRSGPGVSRFDRVERAVSAAWAGAADDLAWYFPQSREASKAMVAESLRDGADLVLVCGGDGTVSSIGLELLGTGVPMGVLQMGSGNGLARHFGEDMDPAAAAAQLASGTVRDMDVGFVNGRPFLVSASFAWDAALVEAYDRLPMRGVASYVLAGAASLVEYRAQPFEIVVDGAEKIEIPDPLLCTVGNLSGWGGGAKIDDGADADDGLLELVAGRRRDGAHFLGDIAEVFSGGSRNLPRVVYRRFSTLSIRRAEPAPVQLDGELADCGRDLEISVGRRKMRVLAPASAPATASTTKEEDK